MCIKHLGSQYSLLGAKWYLIIFVIADIISLVLQAVGGGGAAVQAQRYEDTTSNTHISRHELLPLLLQCSRVSSSSSARLRSSQS